MLTPEQTKETKAAALRIAAESAKKAQFYKYYQGDHQLNFASDKFKNKFGKRLQSLRENLCRTVVKAPCSRLEVINFLADRANTENPAWKLWKRSRMPLHSGKVHREALKTGDAYVIVWADKTGKARITPQLASNITVWKDGETGEITKAAKMWTVKESDEKGQPVDRKYLTLYYPDRIEKYVSKKGQQAGEDIAFEIRKVAGEAFPLPNPFGRVPVFHFTFDEEIDDSGNSILTDVIPLNDTLNKAWADIIGAQEENMRRRRFAAGLQTETDEETGKKINPYKHDDDLWTTDDPEVKFGEFSDADLSQMLAVKQEAVKDIALVSGIPPSYFNLEQTGTAISGEALRKIEARFTNIIQDAQRSFGETWGEVMNFALSVENEQAENLEIEVQWVDAAPVSESENLDNAQKKINLGWSVEQVQRDFGISDEQIEKMKTENAEREKAKVERAAMFFDNGNSLME